MKVTLDKIKNALQELEYEGGDTLLPTYLDEAIEKLEFFGEALNTITVRGRANVDALLGCMIGTEMILGKGDDDG